jgi:hypothetical protein
MRKDFGCFVDGRGVNRPMPHYYFNLTDGVTRLDHNGLDCADDAGAITKATTIADEVAASDNCNPHPDLHISVMCDGREVSRVPVRHASVKIVG